MVVLSVLAIAMTVAGGVVHGRLSNRWGPTVDLARVGRHMDSLPETIGAWQFVEAEELRKDVVKLLDCTGYTIRTYVHRETGARVKIALIAGPPGPIAVHTPEVCYSTRNWRLEGKRVAQTFLGKPSVEHSLWSITLRSMGASDARMRVYYAWTDGSAWRASDKPRYEYARSPHLIKLQLAGLLARGPSQDQDPCREFLDSLLDCGWSTEVDEAG